jgi:hypothetical protein
MLAGSKTAGVITALAKAAAEVGAPVPVEVLDAIQGLRTWSVTMKERISNQAQHPSDQHEHPDGHP